MTTRILTNISQVVLTLTDFRGKVVEPGEQFDGLSSTEQDLRESASIAAELLNGNLVLSDGHMEYTGLAAIQVIQGVSEQVTKDGKRIVTASDRPKDFYRHFTGNGDDVDSTPKKIGLGPHIHLIAEPGATTTLDVKFVDDVYIRDGEIRYLNAGFDSHLTIEVFCPPNVPFPHPTKQGTLDLVNGSFVPNLTNTGAFTTAPVEVKLFRFINDMHLVGDDNLNSINSPEPFLLNYPYFLRYTMSADPDITGPLKAAVTMGMFRKKTV